MPMAWAPCPGHKSASDIRICLQDYWVIFCCRASSSFNSWMAFGSGIMGNCATMKSKPKLITSTGTSTSTRRIPDWRATEKMEPMIRKEPTMNVIDERDFVEPAPDQQEHADGAEREGP